MLRVLVTAAVVGVAVGAAILGEVVSFPSAGEPVVAVLGGVVAALVIVVAGLVYAVRDRDRRLDRIEEMVTRGLRHPE